MRRLKVENFSCIQEAELDLARLTVLIGPQASGKSVLSKLVYFANYLLNEQFFLIEEGKGIEAFTTHVKRRFAEWFPATAWGKSRFCIEFQSGDYKVRLSRRVRKEVASNNVQVSFSPEFKAQYNDLLAQTQRVRTKSDPDADFPLDYMVRDRGRHRLQRLLGEDYVGAQLFVPAGRSFFTNIGKAVAAFEQGRLLDPLTLIFGRYFANLRDHGARPPYTMEKMRFLGPATTRRMLGGRIVISRDQEFIESEDGRMIPFAALSSGQQELLPLWMTLDYWTNRRRFRRERYSYRSLLYIEEPEAHLFPTAQSMLVGILASVVMDLRQETDLVITTHSPYVLSKINNLIKAGQLAEGASEKARMTIGAIIPRQSWLKPNSTAAYAIDKGRLVNLIADDGLIDASYLDSVSNEMSSEFSSLIAIEHGGE